jgi:uncharacterized protein DUF930
MKTRSLAALAAALCVAAPAASHARTSARTTSTEEMLKLAPETRLEQRCNARAMGAVSREHHGMRPDEFVAYAFAEPQIKGDVVKAPGAALRSRGEWYHVSYACQTSEDGLQIQSFDYTLGTIVPKKDWAEHYLVP